MLSLTLESARCCFAAYGDAAWLLTDPRLPYEVANAGSAIYICDAASGRTLLLATAAGALQKLSEQADIDEATYQDIRAAAALLIGDLLTSRSAIDVDTRRGVILGAAFCITETRGFHITKHHGANVQYLLLRYLDTSTGRPVLTPMPMFKTHPIGTNELAATVTHVLLSEQLNFPERFATGPLGFKETQRHVLAGR